MAKTAIGKKIQRILDLTEKLISTGQELKNAVEDVKPKKDEGKHDA